MNELKPSGFNLGSSEVNHPVSPYLDKQQAGVAPELLVVEDELALAWRVRAVLLLRRVPLKIDSLSTYYITGRRT